MKQLIHHLPDQPNNQPIIHPANQPTHPLLTRLQKLLFGLSIHVMFSPFSKKFIEIDSIQLPSKFQMHRI